MHILLGDTVRIKDFEELKRLFNEPISPCSPIVCDQGVLFTTGMRKYCGTTHRVVDILLNENIEGFYLDNYNNGHIPWVFTEGMVDLIEEDLHSDAIDDFLDNISVREK